MGTAMFLLRSMKITPSFGPKVCGAYKEGEYINVLCSRYGFVQFSQARKLFVLLKHNKNDPKKKEIT